MISTLMIFMAMLLIAMLVEPLSERLRIPFSALLVLVGFIGSEAIVALGFDTGLRYETFNDLILHLFVPILVFESAFNIHAKSLLKNIIPILILAVPAMLLASVITATIIYYGIGHPQHFPFAAALLAGILLSATDPVAVVALFKKLGAPERLNILLEGESLFNDATAVVMYSLVVTLALMPGSEISASEASIAFGTSFLGGLFIGAIVGGAANLLYRAFNHPIQHSVTSMIAGLSAFYLSEHVLHVSGIVAILVAALILGETHRKYSSSSKDHLTTELWELAAYIANAILFLLVGITVNWAMFEQQWLAMLIGIAAATIARLLISYGLVPALGLLPKTAIIPACYKPVMMWGGLRGAIALALALSIPTEVDSWFTIQSIAYGVVLFTLFIQAPLMPPLVQKAIDYHKQHDD